MSRDKFLLIISLVKVNINKPLSRHTRGGVRGKKKCHQMSHRGGGGVKKVLKKCHVLFEWPLNCICKI
jgi:hypothetical protein